jgi:hypothetical protein
VHAQVVQIARSWCSIFIPEWIMSNSGIGDFREPGLARFAKQGG